MSDATRRVIVSLSLADLLFLPPWLVLLNPHHYDYYYRPSDPGYVELMALAVDILLIAFVIWLLIQLLARLKRPNLNRAGFALLLVSLTIPPRTIVADYLQTTWADLIRSYWWLAVVLVAGALGLLLAAYFFPNRLASFVFTLLVILSPLFVVNLFSAAWLRTKRNITQTDFLVKTPSERVATNPKGPHVVWIVFDELDQHTAFASPSSSVSLSELDRFRGSAVSARNAYPPNHFTLFSMPALITGELLADANPLRANEVELILADNRKVLWSQQDNVFAEARREGFSSGLIGWTNPYCRVIGDDVDSCEWVPVVDEINPNIDAMSLPLAMSVWARVAVFRLPFAFRLFESSYDRMRAEEHIEEFRRVDAAANRLLDQNLNLSLLHYPIPHQPWVYDARKRSLSAEPNHTYGDNLVLADKTFGQIRQRLERESRWDTSVVLVTSDHWWRQAELINGRRDHRIPFMLKLAGQREAVELDTSFNTILTRKLLLELLRGRLSKPDEVVKWINQNSSLAESPFTKSLP